MAAEAAIDARSLDERNENSWSHFKVGYVPVGTPSSALSVAETARDSLLDEDRDDDDDFQDKGSGRGSPSLSVPTILAPTPTPPRVCTCGKVVIVWEGCDARCPDRNYQNTEIPNPPATALCWSSMPHSGLNRAHAILREVTRRLELDGNVEEL